MTRAVTSARAGLRPESGRPGEARERQRAHSIDAGLRIPGKSPAGAAQVGATPALGAPGAGAPAPLGHSGTSEDVAIRVLARRTVVAKAG